MIGHKNKKEIHIRRKTKQVVNININNKNH